MSCMGTFMRDKIENIAKKLGATDHAVRQWRCRQVPAEWRLRIVDEAKKSGLRINPNDFGPLKIRKRRSRPKQRAA